MKADNRKFLGVVLLVLGIAFLLDRLHLWSFNIFFNGWWTLLLIIPAIYLIAKHGIQVGNVVLLFLGIILFLNERGWNLWGYLVPGVLVLTGLVILFKKKL